MIQFRIDGEREGMLRCARSSMLLAFNKYPCAVQLSLSFVALTFLLNASLAQTVTRGPYLQSGSHSSMVVRWRTDVATDSRVRFGTNSADLKFGVDQLAATIDHEVRLSGLWPGTQFYYSVGTTDGALQAATPTTSSAQRRRRALARPCVFG
jgi:hypothetical protein